MTVESKAKAGTRADHWPAGLSLSPGGLESSPTGSPVVHAVTPHVLAPPVTAPLGFRMQGCAHIHFSRLCLLPSPSPAPCSHLCKAKPAYCSYQHLRAGTPNTCPTPQLKETKASSFLSIITLTSTLPSCLTGATAGSPVALWPPPWANALQS